MHDPSLYLNNNLDILGTVRNLWIHYDDPSKIALCFEFIDELYTLLGPLGTTPTIFNTDLYQLICLIQALNYLISHLLRFLKNSCHKEKLFQHDVLWTMHTALRSAIRLESFWTQLKSHVFLRKLILSNHLEKCKIWHPMNSALFKLTDTELVDHLYASLRNPSTARSDPTDSSEIAKLIIPGVEAAWYSETSNYTCCADGLISHILKKSLWDEQLSSVEVALSGVVFLSNQALQWEALLIKESSEADLVTVSAFAAAYLQLYNSLLIIIKNYVETLLELSRLKQPEELRYTTSYIVINEPEPIFTALEMIYKIILKSMLQHHLGQASRASLLLSEHMITCSGFDLYHTYMELLLMLFQLTLPKKPQAKATCFWVQMEYLVQCGATPLFHLLLHSSAKWESKLESIVYQAVLGGLCLVYKSLIETLNYRRFIDRSGQLEPINSFLSFLFNVPSSSSISFGHRLWLSCGFFSAQMSIGDSENRLFEEGAIICNSIMQQIIVLHEFHRKSPKGK